MNLLTKSQIACHKKKLGLQEDRVHKIADTMQIFGNGFFEYETPETLTKNEIESALCTGGTAVLYRCDAEGSVNYGRLCCTPAYPSSVIRNDGTAEKYVTFGSDYGYELTNGNDFVLLFNNSRKSPDDTAIDYAELINETDKTIKSVIEWCRVAPIPKAITDSDIVKYKEIMTNILQGNLINVISDKRTLLTNSSRPNEDILNLTDPTAAEKLHFLSEAREEFIKRLATLYGIPFNTTAKSAQALSAELHGMDLYSLYIPFDRFTARKESFERVSNWLGGFDFNFRWSDIMAHQIDDIFNHLKEESENVEIADSPRSDRGSEEITSKSTI